MIESILEILASWQSLLPFVALAFLLGGFVKGVIGIGFPLVVIPLLANFTTIPTAVAMMWVSVLLTNFYQVFQGGYAVESARRFWPLLLTLAIGIVIGAQVLVTIDERYLYIIVGFMVSVIALANLIDPRRFSDFINERIAGPLVGIGSGLIGGVSSFFGPPVAIYFVAIKLPRDMFISAVGLTFLVGMTPLYAALLYHGILGLEETVIAVFVLIPVFIGMMAGQFIRTRVPQKVFQMIVLVALVVIGLNMIRRGFVM